MNWFGVSGELFGIQFSAVLTQPTQTAGLIHFQCNCVNHRFDLAHSIREIPKSCATFNDYDDV